jgi:hypothetical protein
VTAIRWARDRVTGARDARERGASLVLALAFLSLFGVFIVALLGFAQTAFLTTTGVHQQGLRQYAASSAIDAAIQRVRPDINLGRDPNQFGGANCGLAYPAVDDEPPVTVTCTGQPGSGDVQPGIDSPPNAILTLATSGVGIDDSKNGTLFVTGPVFSNSDILLHNPGQPKLDATDMPVTARGSCGDTLSDWAYGDLRCNFTGSDPDGNDANYGSRLSEVNLNQPKRAADLSCLGSGSNRVIAYPPGYYTDVDLLTQAVGGCNSNTARWFQPGAYYFDFDFDPASTNNTWNITGKVIGGTPKGWTPGSSAPGNPPPLALAPTTCEAPRVGGPPGVQFIFGGGSKVMLAGSAVVELCPSGLGGPGGFIVLYGQKTGAASPVPISPPRRATNATSVAPNAFNPTTNALPISPNPSPIDNQWAVASLPNSNPAPVSTISMTGFPAAPVAPGGSVNVNVSLTIVHRETYSNTNQIGSLQMKIGTCTVNVPRGTSGITTTYTATNTTDPCLLAAVTSGTFTVDYVVTGQANRPTLTAEIDGVELTGEYTPPVARAQDAGASPIIANDQGGGNAPTFYIWGTTYIVNGDLNIDFKNNTTIGFDRGVILRRLIVAAVPSADTRGAFRLGTGGRFVSFVAFIDGSRKVRALVRFVDTPTTTGRVARIQRWSVTR